MRLAPTVLVAALAASPAHATGGLYCSAATDDTVAANLTLGRVTGFSIVGARITAAGRTWSMHAAEDETPITVAQGAMIAGIAAADFADSNVEEILVSLRVISTETESVTAAAGVLAIPGLGAWPVICEFE
ncbi:MAG: hypothetical protein AAF074_08705 [Pseudomonadota bacterium]